MKKIHFIIARFLVLLALFTVGAFGNRVSLDTTFNGTGYSFQTPAPHSSYGTTFVIQPDGKIVIGGYTINGNQLGYFVLSRLNSDGTLDTTFGNGGSTTTEIGLGGVGLKLKLQPDGKILFLGYASEFSQGFNVAILRYTSNGILDTTFNQVGYRTQNITVWDYGTDMSILPDGKILIVGGTDTGPVETRDVVLMRVTSDGLMDTTFNGTGILVINDPVGESAGPMIRYPNGKILIGGFRTSGDRTNFLLMRLNADGSFDTSFGTNGRTTTVVSLSGNNNYIGTMDLQSDGKIVAGGSNYLARYSPDGILDASFGSNGIVSIPFYSEMRQLKIAEDNKILIATKFGANAGVMRFMPDGARDTNFNGGELNIYIPNNTCNGEDVGVVSGRKILLVGYCSSKFAAFRLTETRTKRHLDFNGDGKTDLSIFRPASGQWWYLDSSTLAYQNVAGTFGTETDKLVPADYTGDGRTDVAVFRPSNGYWYILRSDNNTVYGFPFGAADDVPLSFDYNGDYKADAGVFRPSNGVWYIQKSSGGVSIETFGMSGDKPVPSDYDGDFKTDIAIYRPSSGQWWIKKSTDGSIYAFEFGTAGDRPVQGDYTGDGKTDAAFYRPSTSEWFVLRSEDSSYYGFPFGTTDDLPTPGNFSGDDRYDVAVYRPSTNKWYLQLAEGNFFQRNFGTAGDQLIPTIFVP